jgi:LacI family transcriptional regulator
MLTGEGLVEKHPGKGSWVVNRGSPRVLPRTMRERYIVFVLSVGERGENRFAEAFQSGLFYHLERRCANLGYHLIYKTATAEDHIADIIKGLDASYLVFSSYIFDHLLLELKGLRIPALTVNCQYPGMTAIQSDDLSAAQALVSRLIGMGHRRIAAVTGPEKYETSRDRFAGWRSALINHSIKYESMPVFGGDWSFDSGHEAGKRILELPRAELPDAVFAFNDQSALGVMRALEEGGIAVPGDISVAGYDDIPACIQVNPSLSTVHVDSAAMAGATIQQIHYALEVSGEIPVIRIMVPTYLVIRDSVADRVSNSKETFYAVETDYFESRERTGYFKEAKTC